MSEKFRSSEQEDFLMKIAVRIVTKIRKKSQGEDQDELLGSGVIYKRQGYKYFYIFTALHCLYGDNFEYSQEDIEGIVIQYKYYNKDKFKEITLKPVHLIASNLENDFAILLVPGKEILMVIPGLPEVLISKDWKENKEFNSNGYPHGLKGGALFFNLDRQREDKNGFTVKTDLPLADRSGNPAIETVGGYSGSGVFKKETNKLVGILTELVNPDGWPDFIYCKEIPNIYKLVEEYAGNLKEFIDLEEEETMMNVAEEEKDWETAQKTDNLFSYQKYLKRFPEGKYVDKAKETVEELECWFDTLKKGTEEAFKKYTRNYPEGRFNKQDFEDRLIYLALKNISEYGDTDIFPYPFETFIFKDKTKKIIEDIKTLDKEFARRIAESKNVGPNLGDEFYPQNISTVSPSGNIGFRWVTQIEPIWNAYYLWLVLSIAAEIEQDRLPAEKDTVFSYRFDPDYKTGSLFVKRKAYKLTDRLLLNLEKKDFPAEILLKLSEEIEKTSIIFKSKSVFLDFLKKKIGKKAAVQYQEVILRYSRINFSDWHAFQNHSYEFINNNEYQCVITCDIADFYNRIDHRKLGDALDELEIEDETRNKIKFLLRIFSENKTHGLPIGGNASRILAELILSKIDNYLQQEKIKFCRFVDDFHIFEENEDKARSTLNIFVSELLNVHGLALQKQKTQILSKAEFNKLIKVRLFADADDKKTDLKARFMILETDYPTELIDETVETPEGEKFDIEELLNEELRKTRIQEQFTKRLLTSLKRLKDEEKLSKAFIDIFKKGREKEERLNKLYPIFSTLMIAVYQNFDRLMKIRKTDTKELIFSRLLELFENKSFILEIELYLAYMLKVLGKADRNIEIYNPVNKKKKIKVDLVELLDECYRQNPDSILIKSLIMQNFVKWGCHQWFSSFKTAFYRRNPGKWERRVLLIGFEKLLGAAGKRWIQEQKRMNELTPFEQTIYQWCSEKDKKNIEEML